MYLLKLLKIVLKNTIILDFLSLCSRLLGLGVQLMREKLLTNSVERAILREEIYNYVLDSFCNEPLWSVDDTTVVRKTIETLIKFLLSVRT